MTVEPKETLNNEEAAGERRLAAWEIASVTCSFLIAEWAVSPFTDNSRLMQAVPLVLAFTLMLLSHRARGESARVIGWRLDNLGRAARLLALPMILGAAVLVGVGLLSKSLRFDGQQVLEWALWLPLWGAIQQYALQGFINRRAQVLFGPGWRSILLVAFIFALLHFPNPWLSLVTFAGGLVWAYVYQRVENLPALALSQAIMSMLLALSISPTTLNSLRIGIRYFG